MDPMQLVLAGGTAVTVGVGVVKSFRRRPHGEVLKGGSHRDAYATCGVCGREAEEYDDLKMRWACYKHLSVQAQAGVQERRPQKQASSRRQQYVDPHNAETVRDERVLRQVSHRSRDDVYEDEYLCEHGLDPERCRRCYEIEAQEQQRQAQVVVRRPAATRRASAPARTQREPSRRELLQQVDADPELYEDVVYIVERHPDVSRKQLAHAVGVHPDEVYAFHMVALEELGLSDAPTPTRSRARTRR